MSLTSTRDERVTVVTISSSPKAPKPLNLTWKWSLICQLMYTLSFKPERLMTQNMEKELLNFNNALGTLQILYGLTNVVTGCIYMSGYLPTIIYYFPFFFGALFIASGIACIRVKWPRSTYLLSLAALVNLGITVLAATAFLCYALDAALQIYVFGRGLVILMILLSLLHFFGMAILFLLSLTALSRKMEEDKMKDPELHKPLIEDLFASPAA